MNVDKQFLMSEEKQVPDRKLSKIIFMRLAAGESPTGKLFIINADITDEQEN